MLKYAWEQFFGILSKSNHTLEKKLVKVND